MREISLAELNNLPEVEPEEEEQALSNVMINDLIKNPNLGQQELVIKMREYIVPRLNEAIIEQAPLSNDLRKWIETYSNMLSVLDKSLHGNKVNMNVNMLSGTQIHKIMAGDFDGITSFDDLEERPRVIDAEVNNDES